MAQTVLVSGLSVDYGRNRVVHEVDFSVNEGEFLTLLGPSGCGKTTTLRCIAGLERPSLGHIEIDGKVVSDPARGIWVAPETRSIGMVFQSYAIWPHMTVFKNVAFPLEMRGMPAAEIRQRVSEVLELLGMSLLAQRSATLLSGGQQQRIALARALAPRPKLLLLDEPLSNLDAKLRERTRYELKRLQRQIGITTLYVTHDQSEAMELSDRVLVLKDGRIVQSGGPKEIYDQPADQFVANFVGQANLITGRLTATDDGSGRWLLRTTEGAALTVQHRGVGHQQEAVLVLRPHHILVSPAGQPDPAGNVLPGKVLRSVYLGDRWDCWVEVEGLGELRAQSAPEVAIAGGDSVLVTFQPDQGRLMPA